MEPGFQVGESFLALVTWNSEMLYTADIALRDTVIHEKKNKNKQTVYEIPL